jgi:hypothetical protein
MQPCRKFKERIALSIVDGQNDGAIEDHLLHCAACRQYANELRAICADHAQRAANLPQNDAPAHLHGKIRASVAGDSRPCWRWARPVTAGALAALAIGLYLHWRPLPKPTPHAPHTVTPSPSRQLAEPSYAAYRQSLTRSAEELEAALSRQETGPGSPNELLTVSSRRSSLQ